MECNPRTPEYANPSSSASNTKSCRFPSQACIPCTLQSDPFCSQFRSWELQFSQIIFYQVRCECNAIVIFNINKYDCYFHFRIKFYQTLKKEMGLSMAVAKKAAYQEKQKSRVVKTGEKPNKHKQVLKAQIPNESDQIQNPKQLQMNEFYSNLDHSKISSKSSFIPPNIVVNQVQQHQNQQCKENSQKKCVIQQLSEPNISEKTINLVRKFRTSENPFLELNSTDQCFNQPIKIKFYNNVQASKRVFTVHC